MNIFRYLLILAFTLTAFFSCNNEDDDNGDDVPDFSGVFNLLVTYDENECNTALEGAVDAEFALVYRSGYDFFMTVVGDPDKRDFVALLVRDHDLIVIGSGVVRPQLRIGPNQFDGERDCHPIFEKNPRSIPRRQAKRVESASAPGVPGREDTFASKGQHALYHGIFKPVERLLTHTPLVVLTYMASWAYHDWYWYPFIGSKRVAEYMKTGWGELFRSY